jgi:2-oxoglutarate dehydrogenase E2 component (dihydrolipoamide succinyltransferase)
MSVELKVPSAGESVSEVYIGEWLKKEGDWVEADENVVVVETDKANMEVPAPASGRIAQIKKKQGEAASVGEVIALIDDEAKGEANEPAPEEAKEPDKAPKKGKAEAAEGEPRVSPAAKRLLAEHGFEASEVEATGPGGRVLKEDVLRHIEDAKEAPPAEEQKKEPHEKPAAKAEAPAPTKPSGPREEEVVPMTPMRRRIAERLVEAQQSSASLTTFNEIDMARIMELRKTHQEAFKARYGIKLGFMPLFVKACVDALKQFPAVNAQIRGGNIVYHNYMDIGVAVGGGKGLVVPVIRNAERLSFAEIEKTIADFGDRAQKSTLKLEELQGGTFTISNGGIYGSMLSTPILNPPQTGILGMHNIIERPVAVDGQVVVRPMMYVALTYDHRLVDGREAVSFLRRVKDCLEAPERMLLEI